MDTKQPTLSYLKELAFAAGEIQQSAFGKKHQINFKGEKDLVTEIDHRSEKMLIERIQQDFPGHSINSEESGALDGDVNACWYIDPLDGTTNYAHNLPFYCVSIAYAEEDQVLLGVVYNPPLDECFYTERGKGAWLNDKKIQVSEAKELVKSLLATGFPRKPGGSVPDNLEYFARFVSHAQTIRRLGSAALDFCYVAAGRLDGYWEVKLAAWDVAAGALIAEEAGALVTDLKGSKNYMKPHYDTVVANPTLHAKMMEVIND